MLTKGILIEKYLSSFSKYHIYLLPRPKPPKFLHIPICKNCPLSWRSKRAFPSGETLIFPASRASRYNTLHFASKVVRQRGTLWNPFLPNHRQKISRNIFQKGRPVSCYFAMGIIVSPIANVLICYNCMYGRFGHTEFCRGTSYGAFIGNHVFGCCRNSFGNIIFQKNSPRQIS